MGECTQINIPTVDNSDIKCDEFYYSDCVIIDEIYNKIGNLEKENLNTFFNRLNNKISQMDNKISILEQEILNLKQIINNSINIK